MRINWVVASGYQLDPTVDIEKIKRIGALWGSWTTWRNCSTDNVICHDFAKSKDLIARAFQSVCNFYVPNKHYQDLGRPSGIKLYDGEFNQEVNNLDDIISMHLCSTQSDLILLLGFDLSLSIQPQDPYEIHKYRNYHGLIRSLIVNHPEVQWVCVDHALELAKIYNDIENLSKDTLQKVFETL